MSGISITIVSPDWIFDPPGILKSHFAVRLEFPDEVFTIFPLESYKFASVINSDPNTCEYILIDGPRIWFTDDWVVSDCCFSSVCVSFNVEESSVRVGSLIPCSDCVDDWTLFSSSTDWLVFVPSVCFWVVTFSLLFTSSAITVKGVTKTALKIKSKLK